MEDTLCNDSLHDDFTLIIYSYCKHILHQHDKHLPNKRAKTLANSFRSFSFASVHIVHIVPCAAHREVVHVAVQGTGALVREADRVEDLDHRLGIHDHLEDLVLEDSVEAHVHRGVDPLVPQHAEVQVGHVQAQALERTFSHAKKRSLFRFQQARRAKDTNPTANDRRCER